MPQLLLELFSEEIPARMQGGAARDLERMAKERLAEAGLTFEGVKTYAGPRRLTLVVEGLPAAQADRVEERKGPKANAPDQALQGFLRSTGLTRDQLVERDGVLFATLAKAGRPTPEIVAEMVEAIVRQFPWPKSMRWAGSGTLRWVRPLKRILCVFDGAVVPFAIEGIESGMKTEGHRFMGLKQPFRVSNFNDYEVDLRQHFVVLDAEERKTKILSDATAACWRLGLELVDDVGLLDEVAGLAEWPTVIVGDMDPAFLDLPPEVIRTSMRTHQKYFAVRYPSDTGPPLVVVYDSKGKGRKVSEGDKLFPENVADALAVGREHALAGREGLAPHFLVVANIEASDGGAMVAAGNARVLSARLNDARFFWDEDRKPGTFARWIEKLQGVTFHAKLGTMYQRVERITALAREIAPLVGCTPDQVEKAAEASKLCKADLASGMVGEFPELQGIMGGYYARDLGLDPEVEGAIRDHYRPAGPGDSVPTAPVSVAVALADKLDTLVGFFVINERPTGSKDPYALRRAALGVIRIVLESQARLSLKPVVMASGHSIYGWLLARDRASAQTAEAASADLLAFFADRLKVLLRDQGKRHDLVDAVFALGDDDLVRIVARVEALSAFLASEDGANLLAGYRRAVNILKAEAKKNPNEAYDGPVDPARLVAPEETALNTALQGVLTALAPQLAAEDFAAAMTSLAALRKPVDAFFDKVLVNDADPAVRLNRLRLLSQMRDAAGRVADFSLITG